MYIKINLDYNSLEPYIDNKTFMLHYNAIYNSYIDKLNKLLKKNNYKDNYSLNELVDKIDMFPLEDRGEILYNLGGALNHKLYFYEMSDKGNNIPYGEILKDINKYFGSYDNFKKEFIKKALNLVGSGYTFLVMDESGKLQIINTSNEDTPYSYGFIPIIVLDLWEHSYYLKYTTNKEAYINNWFNLLDFKKINDLYIENKKSLF